MNYAERQALVWKAISYAAARGDVRELTLSDLAQAGIGPAWCPILSDELHKRGWSQYLDPAAYIVLSIDPRTVKAIEDVEFGVPFVDQYENLRYVPHDAPSGEEEEGKGIVFAKNVGKDRTLNPRGRWHRYSWGTLVYVRPDVKLRRK
jgi:hypothetical protein